MRVLGVDPGLVTTGYGVVDFVGSDPYLVEAGVVRSDPSKPLELRLLALYDGLSEVIREFVPDAMALEEVYSRYEYPHTAILMGHARGVLCLAAAKHGVPIHSYSASHVKSAITGSGTASKRQVQRTIQARLDLSRIPRPNDVADALAVAICHGSVFARSPATAREAAL
ncbi:MAG: crossover junction endodeoxyribonuclease RuvC [Armatimonadota bacterium]